MIQPSIGKQLLKETMAILTSVDSLPSLRIKLSSRKNFIKAIDQNGSWFLCLK
jgi:hypothetical protein